MFFQWLWEGENSFCPTRLRTASRNLRDILDLSPREIATLAPLVILTIFFGIYPAALLDVTALSVKKLVQNYELAVKTAELVGVGR